jgi:predicted transcriptional regulator
MEYDQFATMVERLLNRLVDRVPAAVIQDLREYEEAGELGELVSLLAAVVVKRHIPITEPERVDLYAVVDFIGEPVAPLSKALLTDSAH